MQRVLFALLLAAAVASAQAPDHKDFIGLPAEAPRIAVPDLRGIVGQGTEAAFNTTLWDDLEASGMLDMQSKSYYPRTTPIKPEDLRAGDEGLPDDPGARGSWLMGWSEPPVQARYLVFGSLESLGERLVLNGWVYDVTVDRMDAAYVFGKRYYAEMDEEGAREIAHDFSRDILQNLGLGVGLAGSRIYFTSSRSGAEEIWSMDYDGKNLKQHTNYGNLALFPAISPDGTRLAFTTFVEGTPSIYVHSLETGRKLTFYNQTASLNMTAEFTTDNKVLYSSSITGHAQIYEADLDGRNLRRISYSRSIATDPAVNPKTGAQVAFVSDRSGLPQVYLMDRDGANVRKLSLGGGDAVQPSWDPQGQNVAFAWTRGFEPGNYNIFLINVATEELVQLTHGAGRNEHPTWAPSGSHVVFTSDRNGTTQIYTMRADGTQLKRLTNKGRNRSPVWAAR